MKMQHTTKMVMVPQDTYSSLMSQQKQVYSPVVQQLSNLDQELQSILNNPNLPEEVKYHQYRNVFGRYQQLRNEQFRPAAAVPAITEHIQTGDDLPMEDLPVPEKQVIDGLPKTVRMKGRLLLNHLKDHKRFFNWLNSGELVIDGKPIAGSNVTDLVHHATRNRTAVVPPAGYEEFEKLLQATNVPKEAMKKVELATATPVSIGTSFSPRRLQSTPRSSGRPLIQDSTGKQRPKRKIHWKPY